MYLVVYIFNENRASKTDGAFAVIPYKWVENFEDHMQKFLNGGLNSTQVFKYFWTPSRKARMPCGAISFDFEPNFNLGFNKKFPEEGVYLCKLIKAKGI